MVPDAIYRFMSQEKYAEDFLNGRIRISTLASCRELEANKGGDKFEGNISIVLNNFQVEQPTRETFRVLNNTGIFASEGIANVSIGRATRHNQLDAHVLCFSKENSDYIQRVFGKFGVIIHNPKELFRRIVNNLSQYDVFFINAIMDHVLYEGHKHSAYDKEPIKKLGLCKRKSLFYNEREYRMLFMSRLPVKPEFIEIGSIRDIAKRT